MKIFSTYCFSVAIFLAMSLNCFSVFAAEKLDIIYNKGLLTVMAKDAMPKDIFLALGKECNIEIIVKGKKFPKNEVTIELKDMPIKEAVKKLVRACAIKSYFMEFKKDDQGKSRLVKINLSVGRGSQRRLTSTQQKERNKRPSKSSFTKDTDFQWDGSAPIAFPEFQDELAYDESEFGWDENAKSFSENTMDLVPPGVRDMVAEQIIKMSDQIAKERETDTVTSDIIAEALQRIGKQARMPPDVMKLMPKDAADFDKPKIPIDPIHLQEEYRD